MATIKDENHLTILGFMRTRLNLVGNELLVYALIYSFSQDKTSEFRGSLDYIRDFIGASRATVIRCLKNLEENKLIEKTYLNLENGSTNGYKIVEETIERGVYQNDTPRVSKRDGGCIKMTHPVYQNDTRIYNNISNSNIESDNKVSKKESRKEGSYKHSARASYDEIIDGYGLSQSVRDAVVDFIRHCQLNEHKLNNTTLKRMLDNLITHPEDKQRQVILDAIDKGAYMVRARNKRHYDPLGTGGLTGDYQSVMDNLLPGEEYAMLKRKLWQFIQHCAANGQKMTNERLLALIVKLKKLYRLSEWGLMIDALDKAMARGYYDIKDGEGWLAEVVRAQKQAGVDICGNPIDAEDDEDDEE